jgi:hypothetical protein
MRAAKFTPTHYVLIALGLIAVQTVVEHAMGRVTICHPIGAVKACQSARQIHYGICISVIASEAKQSSVSSDWIAPSLRSSQ